jgi:molecular chaperone GrpE
VERPVDEMIPEASEATSDGAEQASSVGALREQLEAANAKAEDNWSKFLLAMADFENYKKQMEKRVHMIVSDHRKSLLLRFLPVMDNLERALQFNTSGDDKLRDGIEQTLRGFETILASEGVKAIEVKGKPFDPRIAEAIGTLAASDGAHDDTVLEVAQKGYTLGEEVLRPAKVLVAKNSA